MTSLSHVLLGNCFAQTRKKWSRSSRLLFTIGSILPDVPLLVLSVYTWIRHLCYGYQFHTIHVSAAPLALKDLVTENPQSAIVGIIQASWHEHLWLLNLQGTLHCAWIWIILIIAGYAISKSENFKMTGKALLSLGCGALFFHILVDWITHKQNAPEYLWPVFKGRIPGLIERSDPLFFTIEMFVWVTGFAAIVIPPLIKGHLKRQGFTDITLREQTAADSEVSL